MNPQLLLINHEQDQSDRGHAHRRVGADSQLAHGLVEEQVGGVVVQRGDKVAADGGRKTKKLFIIIIIKTDLVCDVCVSPAGRACLSPQLHTQQRHGDVLAGLDVLVVDGTEDWRRRQRHTQTGEGRYDETPPPFPAPLDDDQ